LNKPEISVSIIAEENIIPEKPLISEKVIEKKLKISDKTPP